MHAHAIFVTRLMQSLARVCQNQASEVKRALLTASVRALVAAGVNAKLYSHDVKLKSSNKNLRLKPPVNLDIKSFP